MEFLDFHAHVLPGMDDGAADVEESLELLRLSREQGVTALVATPHFYAYDESPEDFLRRRLESALKLKAALAHYPHSVPRIGLGAEVAYFPGISEAEGLKELAVKSLLLVEPPMNPWSDYLLDEIEDIGPSLGCVPVIAHLDRFVRFLEDPSLVSRVRERRMLVQMNVSSLLRPESSSLCLECLERGDVHLLGSDAHNCRNRLPHWDEMEAAVSRAGLRSSLNRIQRKAFSLLVSKN